jgi:hypothetical protein
MLANVIHRLLHVQVTYRVHPRNVKIPIQSIAFMPSTKEVCSWRMSKKSRISKPAKPLMGRLI